MSPLPSFLAVISIKDLAELIRAIAWPSVALIAIFRFHRVIESLLERLTKAEALGVKVTLAKLDKEISKAEAEAKKLPPKQPETPKPRN